MGLAVRSSAAKLAIDRRHFLNRPKPGQASGGHRPARGAPGEAAVESHGAAEEVLDLLDGPGVPVCADGFDRAEALRPDRPAHQMTGDSQAALRTCAEGLKLDHEDAELWFRKAVVHRQRGESSEAEACWRGILTLRRPDQFCSVDQGIYGHLTRRNLAVLAAERGDQAEAEKLWREILAESPGDREALNHLSVTIKPNGEGTI